MNRFCFIVVCISLSGLLLGGCSTSGMRTNSDLGVSARFERPEVSAAKARSELKKRLDERQNELDIAVAQDERLAAVEVPDAQVPKTRALLAQRINALQDDVSDLSWRYQRASTAADAQSFEDFSMSLVDAPQPLPAPDTNCKAICKELEETYVRLEKEINSLALNISFAELDQQYRGALEDEQAEQLAVDQLSKDRLEDEYNKTRWRVYLARIAVNGKSKLDLSPLLVRPQSETVDEYAQRP